MLDAMSEIESCKGDRRSRRISEVMREGVMEKDLRSP
jgi:hypothetical protein